MAPESSPSATQIRVNQRAASPYRCDRAVQFWKAGQAAPMWGQLRDLSLSGCYVELKTPAAQGTELACY